ncbi:MAG: glycosyltransferase family 4 protein [Sphingobacteriaceae bacterium]|nr:glycosyltransferase family 4 protein [Sphingobacteriaceae bacterium]
MLKPSFKIAYLSSENPKNKKVWSGTHYSIYKELCKIGDVEILGPFQPKFQIWLSKILNQLSLIFTGKRISYRQSIYISKGYAAYFNEQLNAKTYDLIVAPAASCEIAFIETKTPILYITDGTFASCLNYHKSLSRLRQKSIEEGNQIEKLALQKAKFVIVSSEWAKKSVLEDYGSIEDKVHVLPFGANLETIPTQLEIKFDIPDKWKILFVAVYWEDKGGDRAYACFKELKDKGYPVEFSVLGCKVPEKYNDPDIKIIPFIDKNSKGGQEKMAEIFKTHHFLILPTRFDCTPIVINEASAFGLPSFIARTGGIEGHLKDGVNGFTISYTDTGSEYAENIEQFINHPEKYVQLRTKSRKLYEEELNWDHWRKQIEKIISS